MTPTPGGPADRAGIRAGDVIEAVGGVATKGLSLYEASDLLQGAEGSEVGGRPQLTAAFAAAHPPAHACGSSSLLLCTPAAAALLLRTLTQPHPPPPPPPMYPTGDAAGALQRQAGARRDPGAAARQHRASVLPALQRRRRASAAGRCVPCTTRCALAAMGRPQCRRSKLCWQSAATLRSKAAKCPSNTRKHTHKHAQVRPPPAALATFGWPPSTATPPPRRRRRSLTLKSRGWTRLCSTSAATAAACSRQVGWLAAAT